MVDGRLAVDWFNRLVGWLVDCSPCGGGVSLSKPTKRENRLCDCCYSGKGAAIVVWNLIGICERAAPRHRRWQEMREAEQKAWCVQGEAAYIIVFDTRQEQEGQKARRKKEGTAPTNTDKDPDATRTSKSVQEAGTHHVSAKPVPSCSLAL